LVLLPLQGLSDQGKHPGWWYGGNLAGQSCTGTTRAQTLTHVARLSWWYRGGGGGGGGDSGSSSSINAMTHMTRAGSAGAPSWRLRMPAQFATHAKALSVVRAPRAAVNALATQ
jgi:hypothetical protein